jgi:metal-responsive CopG/Arc/MetJ family transcriptional regulator
MTRARPIPVKLSDELIARLDSVSKRSGLNNRSAVIKFCCKTFCDYIDRMHIAGLPDEWRQILTDLDQRHHRYTRLSVAEAPAEYSAKPPTKKARP